MTKDYIPKYAKVAAEQFKEEFMKKNINSALSITHRFFYNDDCEACIEFTVNAKAGWSFDQPTWIGQKWGKVTGSIGNGLINYTLTKKKHDEIEYKMERRRKDSVFNQIEQVIFQIATDYNYNFAKVGISAKHTDKNIKLEVCDGYSNVVIERLKNHPEVSKVEKWVSNIGNHAWNLIHLKDGRRIYCDATWYDGSNIDKDGFVSNIPERDPVNLTFDIDEFNSLGGAIDVSTGKTLKIHHAWKDAEPINSMILNKIIINEVIKDLIWRK